jgi:phosphoglycolate phosphatase-like HAD superfamily hydrolase
VRDLLTQHGLDASLEHWEKLREGYLARLPDSLNRHNGRVLPGILSLLQALRKRGDIAIGLLTGNIRAGARVKLGHFGLFEHFAFGGFGDHHFDRDDVAREALAAVHAHVGAHVVPERVWVIGDTPLDVRCARAIGAKVVAVATGLHSALELRDAAPDLTLSDFTDPEPFITMLP